MLVCRFVDENEFNDFISGKEIDIPGEGKISFFPITNRDECVDRWIWSRVDRTRRIAMILESHDNVTFSRVTEFHPNWNDPAGGYTIGGFSLKSYSADDFDLISYTMNIRGPRRNWIDKMEGYDLDCSKK